MNTPHSFSNDQLSRYARHFSLPGFGMEAQQRLGESSVLVIGAGGLGAPVLMYLAAAGVGTIGIVDFDTVDLTNLQRQVLYTTDQVGQSKAQLAAQRLRALNPDCTIQVHGTALQRDNALALFEPYDLIVDGTDNFPTRYLANDVAVILGKTYIYGSIYRYEGQVSVFNALLPDGTRSINYRNLYPSPPHPDAVPNCAEGGVLGVLPGIIGSMQANEAIKMLSGVGTPLIDKLFLYDAATGESRTIRIPPQEPVPVRELIDYQAFCSPAGALNPVPQMSPFELKEALQKPNPPVLIDVREPYERALDHLGGEHIPLGSIEERAERLEAPARVVVYCQSGQRSAKAIRKLRERFGFEHLINLEGGITAYRRLETEGTAGSEET
jgi:sulfur-carrier protein adenylyltransferase/sulfurtransferase